MAQISFYGVVFADQEIKALYVVTASERLQLQNLLFHPEA